MTASTASVVADILTAFATVATAGIALWLGVKQVRHADEQTAHARQETQRARKETKRARKASREAQRLQRIAERRERRRAERVQAEQIVAYVKERDPRSSRKALQIVVANYSQLPVFDIAPSAIAPQDHADDAPIVAARLLPGQEVVLTPDRSLLRLAPDTAATKHDEGRWVLGASFRDVTGRRWVRGIDGTLRFIESVVDVDELDDWYVAGPEDYAPYDK